MARRYPGPVSVCFSDSLLPAWRRCSRRKIKLGADRRLTDDQLAVRLVAKHRQSMTADKGSLRDVEQKRLTWTVCAQQATLEWGWEEGGEREGGWRGFFSCRAVTRTKMVDAISCRWSQHRATSVCILKARCHYRSSVNPRHACPWWWT